MEIEYRERAGCRACLRIPARNVWRELSAGLAMAGFAVLLMEFVLSGRSIPVAAVPGGTARP